ncbi:translocation and assembly module TamA [Constrictibacter sp. MBR-5]|jgi:translocation and assembly module TamA|uniref:autotransporter assembly complex protein TamA n=1 Tax=Constrictibacter sp. MBR-5 TaxID=3156467 RepID=UPI0033907F06
MRKAGGAGNAPDLEPGTVRGRWISVARAVAVSSLVVSGCSTGADEPPPSAAASVQEPAGRAIPYDVDIDGVEGDLDGLLRESAELITLKDNPPLTMARLRARAEGDVATFERVLRSRGYYASKIAIDIDDKARPVDIDIDVTPGPQYRLDRYALDYKGGAPDGVPKEPADIGIELGTPAESSKVVDAQARLLTRLGETGYPLAEVTDREAIVDHDKKALLVTLKIDPGTRASYGQVKVQGLNRTEEGYVQRLVDLRRGSTWDQRQVETARTRLAGTGLFESVAIDRADEAGPDGQLPLTVRLSERAPRTIGGSLTYGSSEGAAAEVYWEHRNLSGRNEKLRFTGTVAELEQGVAASFRKPNWRRLDQDLLADAEAKRTTYDAYDEMTINSSIGASRKWGGVWTGTVATGLEYSIIDDDGEKEKFLLASLPASLARDTTDSLLDPTRGSRLAFTVTPYVGTGERDLAFLAATIGGSSYYRIDEEGRFVAAGRAKLGSLVGAGTEDIPATKRFYAGGGGSVRGYAFQAAGPLDDDDDPVGGRSLIEIGAEMRIKITESIGIVPFIDGGSVFDDPYPTNFSDLLWAAGLGGRYYTALGPIRLDVAFPLNGRDSDDFFQFYVSIGQAF